MGGAKRPSEATARAAIERHGILLVYPVDNRPEPPSLWQALHPGTAMRWAWDEGADERVVALWHLRERLAASRRVVYGKWYRDRAVFFSPDLFAAMLAHVRVQEHAFGLEARELLALLNEDSPRSTRELRRAAGLAGKANDRVFTVAMRELWSRLAIVGTGEVDDGAFPSLAVGATRWIFEATWDGAAASPTAAQRALVARHLPQTSAFGKHWRKVLASARPSPEVEHG